MIHTMESILCKPSENEALENWKKFIELPGFYVKYGGPCGAPAMNILQLPFSDKMGTLV